MKPKINYHYRIPFKLVEHFDFVHYGVDEECYKYRIITHIDKAIEELINNNNSRRSVIVTHTNFQNYACLISLQFQIHKKKLIVIANFRSQCRLNGRPSDDLMLQYISTYVYNKLKNAGIELKKYNIYVNVANYHENLDLLKENLSNEEVVKNLLKIGINLNKYKYKIK